MLRTNPDTLDNKIHQLGVWQLLNRTKDLKGERRIAKMRELACEVDDTLSMAIEELEKDLELNPRSFLGVALYPDKLWSSVTFAATIGLGLL